MNQSVSSSQMSLVIDDGRQKRKERHQPILHSIRTKELQTCAVHLEEGRSKAIKAASH